MECDTTDSLNVTPFFLEAVLTSSEEELSREELEVDRTNSGREEDTTVANSSSCSSERRRAKPNSQDPPPRCFTADSLAV
jgi:hypothetical protein